jgi:hypothetical protein
MADLHQMRFRGQDAFESGLAKLPKLAQTPLVVAGDTPLARIADVSEHDLLPGCTALVPWRSGINGILLRPPALRSQMSQ